MAGTRLAIDQAELERLDAFMAEQAARDTSGLMKPLGEYLLESTQRRFKDQVKPNGEKWKELDERYARRKKRNKDKVLTLRGYLRSYIHYQVTGGDSVEVGSNQKYAAIHQFGGEIDMPERQATVRYRSVAGRVLFAGKKHKRATEKAVTIPVHFVKIPARPFLGLSAEDDREISRIIRDWLAGGGK